VAAYRVFDPNPVFWNLLATDPLRAGWIQFYNIGTTTPKNTWSDAGLTVLNTNPIVMDAGGRFTVNVFGDGDYTMVAFDRFGAMQWTRDIISGQSAGQTIPPLEVDEFLTNDGSNLLWRPVRQLPDATGAAGRIPVTTGTGPDGYTLQNLSSANALITYPSGGIKLSDGTNARMIQFGTDTVPSSGTFNSAKLITFGTAFSSAPRVFVELNGRANPAGGIPAHLVESISTTGANVIIDTNGFNNITQSVPFSFYAIGTVAA
jgi:hypothetical protein